jgi:GT2 family glycosyltransferase
VLIVNFGVYDDLDRSLASLGPFLDDTDEVVVVDNASQPDRLAWLAARHRRVRIIAHRQNLGFAAGVNLAARASSAPMLLVLNPDTFVNSPLVRVLETWLRDHPDTGVVGPRVINPDGTTQASARRFPGLSAAIGGRSSWLTRRFPNNWISRWQLVGRDAKEPMDIDWLAGSCFMTPRSAFDRAGGFDEGFFLYCEDVDYCHRLRAMGLKCTYVPSVSVHHAGGHSAALVPELAVRAFHESALRLHMKHGSWFVRRLAPIARVALLARTAWRLRYARQRLG